MAISTECVNAVFDARLANNDAELKRLARKYGVDAVNFVLAAIYDERDTLLRMQAEGKSKEEIEAYLRS